MNFFSFLQVLTGALLNAAAQPLPRAGADGIRAFAFAAGNIVPARAKVVCVSLVART